MKKILLIIMLLPFVTLAQENFYTLKGKFKEASTSGKVYLNYYKDNIVAMDSAIINNGAFEFKGSIEEPLNVYVHFVRRGSKNDNNRQFSDGISLYLDKGITILNIIDSLKRAVISDSGINNDYSNYEKILDNEDQDEMEGQLVNYIKQNPSSYFCLAALQTIGGPYFDVSKIEPLFDGLSEKLKKSAGGNKISAFIATIKSTAIGQQAPDFIHVDTNNKSVKLSDFRGKYVLIDFWASWCGPCRAENPKVLKAYNLFKDKNFTVLGLSLDEDRDKWLKAIKDDRMPWTQLIDSDRTNKSRAGDLYAIKSIPTNFLIDPSGKIIGKNLFGEYLEKKLTEIMR